jgi:hypothetical protein
LTDKPTSLEIKHSGKGKVRWSTRGQLGVESKFKAATGFHSLGNRGYDQSELVNHFQETLKSAEKYF